MFQIKNIKKIGKKSKAQHVVELALMLPIFIICFSFTFQLMVETFSKYKFSYIFTNSVRNTINNPVIYESVPDEYSITEIVQSELASELTLDTNRIPFTDVYIETVESDETTFFRGAYQLATEKLFFGETGKEYFYFTIPVNYTYTSPIVLNKTTNNVESYFNFYFKYYSTKYYETDETESEDSGDDSDSDSDDTENNETEDEETEETDENSDETQSGDDTAVGGE